MSVQTVIALAFTTWVNKVRKELGTEEQKLSGAELHGVLGKVFSRTRKGFIADVAPAIQTAYAAGLVEAGVGMDEKTIAVLATNYASRIVDYSNKMTMMAAAEAYQGVINRKKQPKTAFTFMRDTFGADRRAVRSLLKMFDQDELKNNTLRDIPSKKKKTMDRYVVAAIKRRAEVLGGEEAHATKELAKAFGWNLAKAQGKAPKGAVKRWITARDELVCKNCGPMNFVDVGLDEKFEMPDGKIIWSPQAHINCRCKVVMVVEVKNAKAPTSAFQRSRIRKSEGNPYRRRDGQFASRNENNWAPTYQGGGSYGSHLSRVRAPEPQRARVAVLERPRQDDINAEFARLTSQLSMMPQVQATVKPYDDDVRAVAIRGSLPQLDTISTPSSLSQLAAAPPQVAPAPLKLDWTAPVMAPAVLTMPAILESIPKLDVDTATNVMLNLPEALPEMVVDANATAIQQNSDPGTVYETEEIMVGIHITSDAEREEGLTVSRLAAGTTLTSDLGEIERTLSNAYMVVADDVTEKVWEDHNGSLSIFENGRTKPVDRETLRSAVFGYAQEQYQYHLRSLNVTGGGPDVPNSADWAFDRSAAWSNEIYQDTNDIEAAQLSGRILREKYHFDRLISSSAPTVYTMSTFNEAKADYSYEEGMLVLNEAVDINLPDAETSSGGRSLGEVAIDFAWDEYED